MENNKAFAVAFVVAFLRAFRASVVNRMRVGREMAVVHEEDDV
jgi:hypothetical protein